MCLLTIQGGDVCHGWFITDDWSTLCTHVYSMKLFLTRVPQGAATTPFRWIKMKTPSDNGTRHHSKEANRETSQSAK